MNVRSEIRDAPRALKETLQKGRPEYEALVRQTRWGDGPVYMVGDGSSYVAALTGACAFECLLGWPVVASRAADFVAYSASVIRPRSVLLVLSPSGESDETLEAAREARSRGSVLLALTSTATSRLAEMADGVFLLRTGEESAAGLKTVLCQQAAMSFIGLVAARALKRHHQQLDVLEREFRNLPEQAEWILTRLTDAVRSFAAELQSVSSLLLVGAGFYYPCALQAAPVFERLTSVRAEGIEATEFLGGPSRLRDPNAAALFLSGSRCRLKKKIHESARGAQKAGVKVFAVTDTNDRELSEISTLAVLLPSVTEMVGSTLTLLLVQWLACCLWREQAAAPKRSPSSPHA